MTNGPGIIKRTKNKKARQKAGFFITKLHKLISLIHSTSLFRFAFKMTPRRQGGSDAGIHLTYAEEHSDADDKGAA